MKALRSQMSEARAEVDVESIDRVLTRAAPILRYRSAAPTFYERRGKRLLDIALGTVLFVGFLPIMAVVALAVLLVSGWPVLYRSRRVGAGGHEFWMLKFRSMRRDADKALHRIIATSPNALVEFRSRRKLSKDPRVMSIGRLLRAWSIDELPQLLNVILGQMSLVGPRPVPRDELETMYGSLSTLVLSVRPGITGLWQVNGRSRTTYSERVHQDCAYAADSSFFQDLRILLLTVVAVLKREGAA